MEKATSDYPPKSPEDVAEARLEELVDRSLVLVHKRRSAGGIKTCSIHSAVWHLCVNAADKDGFFCAVTRYTKGRKASLPTTASIGRRLCIRKNILLSIKDVNRAMLSVSKARSFFCSGRDHPYPLAVCSDFGLLRVLDVLSIRFYGFPVEILKLVQLRYLAPHREAIFRIHLLTDLLTLSNVTNHSCAEDVLRGTPNLKKLGVCIEVSEHDHASDPSARFRPSGASRPAGVIQMRGRESESPFDGRPVWEVGEDEFRDLRFLQLEDLDLEDWSGGGLILKRLERLIVRHCYRLREIPEGIDYVIYLQVVEVVDCSPSLVGSAMRVKEMQQDMSNDDFQVVVE
ncbi:disease resistance protein [Striga asiatica]|uniref:Disease resistance protein n=1 Tax=Striga asiatica TaxID=4170 RepID=A0A5A7PNF2_STRAF|nr:disease resistance protein [Striga asiatica]